MSDERQIIISYSPDGRQASQDPLTVDRDIDPDEAATLVREGRARWVNAEAMGATRDEARRRDAEAAAATAALPRAGRGRPADTDAGKTEAAKA